MIQSGTTYSSLKISCRLKEEEREKYLAGVGTVLRKRQMCNDALVIDFD